MYALQNVSAVAIDVPAVAVGAERMKLVISTEAECPALLVGRSGSSASVTTEALLPGAEVADARGRRRNVQAPEHLTEVLPQFRQLLSQLLQSWLG